MAASTLSPKQLQEIAEAFLDYQTWIPAHFKLHTKAGDEIPAALSPAGLRLFAAAEKQRAEGKPVRLLCLKARQVYMSYATALYLSRTCMFMERQSSLVYAHEHASAKKIFNYYDEIYESYRSKDGIKILKRTRRVLDQLMQFEGGGEITFRSADNTASGRSSPNRHLHLSEYAFWRDAANLMTGVMASVPKDRDTTVIVESTANGAAGDFYDFWMRERYSGANNWACIFFAWWEHPEYSLPIVGERYQFQESLTKDERELMQRYGLTLEQVNWRRFTIETEYRGNLDSFRQEYPSNPEEAFLTSGRPRFQHVDLARQPIIKDAPDGELEQVRIGSQYQITFMPMDRGALRMFRRPEPGHLYVIGADTAEGIDASNATVGSGDPDYSVAQVFDRESGEQVARYRARVHPTEFGRILADLGHAYNDAFIVPEVNSSGLATLAELQRQDYPAELIYQRDRQADDRRHAVIQEIGWKTTTATRQRLVSALDSALRERAIYIRDDITLAELYRFVINAKGKAEAAQGAHDDCVISAALGAVGLHSAPRVRLPSKRRSGPVVRYRTRLDRDEEDDD